MSHLSQKNSSIHVLVAYRFKVPIGNIKKKFKRNTSMACNFLFSWTWQGSSYLIHVSLRHGHDTLCASKAASNIIILLMICSMVINIEGWWLISNQPIAFQQLGNPLNDLKTLAFRRPLTYGDQITFWKIIGQKDISKCHQTFSWNSIRKISSSIIYHKELVGDLDSFEFHISR